MKLKSRYPEIIEYNAQSVWDGKTGGTATLSGGRQIVFDTPETYGGRGQGVCPDEMFVAAVLGCLNNTFLDFQRRFEMELTSMELHGKAVAKFDNTGYQITSISIWGEIKVGEDELETGERCVQLAKDYCHLARTIKDCIPFDYDIKVNEAP